MNTDLAVTVLRQSVQRNGRLPPSEQIRATVEMAVISGEFPDGMPLPSVRALADAVKVAPNTVARAYTELRSLGIVRALPRRGYFVVSPREEEVAPVYEGVAGLIDEALRASNAAGFDSRQFLTLVAERARARDLGQRVVAVVGQHEAALDKRVEVVAQATSDLHVQVIGLSFEELRTPAGSARAAGVDWYLVPILETREAAALLGPHAHRIMPMSRILTPEARGFVTSRPVGTRFGIISGTEDYIGRMVAALKQLRPLAAAPLAAAVDDRAGVEQVLREADAIIIGSTARSRLAPSQPLSKPHIEFTYVPDEATLRRLRSRLEMSSATGAPRAGAPSSAQARATAIVRRERSRTRRTNTTNKRASRSSAFRPAP